jgi:ubiquinone/menaquinone biosynthesis C-methylase UbiE
MFIKSAKYYDALYHFKDYKEASQRIQTLIQQINPYARTLLDVGCGTGKHVEYLRESMQVEGLDLSAEMLEIARARCPGVPFHQGDMVHFDVGHSFDVITCLFSSIAYVRTVENMNDAVATMAHHLNPQGILFIEPWFSPENYWVGRLTANFVDQPDLKIAWMYVSEIEGRLSISNMHFMVGTTEGITHFTERHENGLFTHEEYLDAIRRVDLEVEYDPVGLFKRGLYIGKKTANPKTH